MRAWELYVVGLLAIYIIATGKLLSVGKAIWLPKG